MTNWYANAAPDLTIHVVDLLPPMVLGAVTLMLMLGVWRQFVQVGHRGELLDRFAALPQWRFFGQSEISSRQDKFDDHHLLVRVATVGGQPGSWREIIWSDERRWLHAVWSGQARSKGEILEHVALLCRNTESENQTAIASSMSYLVVLRYCLDERPLKPGMAIQFAVVSTRGRGNRQPETRLISRWHTN
jgi:hypothetical protein